MKSELLITDRLRLVPMTIDTCNAELEKSKRLSSLLDAEIPCLWPPLLLSEETIHEFITMLSDPDNIRLCSWYWVRISQNLKEKDLLIGGGGLYINEDGSCEIGYSVLDDYQSQGYATEAVRSIMNYIFSTGNIDIIYATTYPYLVASMRVLEKCGFFFEGAGKEEGTIRYFQKKNIFKKPE